MQIRTFAETGLILFAGNNNMQNFIYLLLDGGRIKGGFGLESTDDGDPAVEHTRRPVVNDGKWHWVCCHIVI